MGEKLVHEVFYQRLLAATITDHAGNEADTFEAEFDDRGNDLEVPSSQQCTPGYLWLSKQHPCLYGAFCC